jgi:antitoxin Phd
VESRTIAEARQELPALVHEVERSGALQLTRRGQPVAVLLSQQQYQHLQEERKPDLWEAITRFREAGEPDDVGLTEAELNELRARQGGRDFNWPE